MPTRFGRVRGSDTPGTGTRARTCGLRDDRWMIRRVAISDPLPLFRQGVVAALATAGFAAETPADLLGWVRVDEPRLLVLGVLSASDWALLAEVCQTRVDVLVLAVLEEPRVAAYVRALSTGADGVVAREAEPDRLRTIFAAATRGDSLLPADVVRELARGSAGTDRPEPGPTAEEREWLRHLAQGATVAQLADHARYSERTMFRLLRDLYARLGTVNRSEALMRARDQGWI